MLPSSGILKGPPPSWQVIWPWGFLPCVNCLWRIHFDIWQNQYNIVKFKNKIKLKKIKIKMMWTVHISPLLWGRKFLKIPSPEGMYKVTEYLLGKHIDKASLAWKIKLLNLIKKFNTILLWKLSKGLRSNCLSSF